MDGEVLYMLTLGCIVLAKGPGDENAEFFDFALPQVPNGLFPPCPILPCS